MPGDFVEDMKGDAAARRALSGQTMFEDLGEPIQKLLLEVEKEGKAVDEKTLELLTHVTVKQLAKIFEMLGQGEDPETILAWLKRRARKNKGGQDDFAKDRKEMIKTGAERDPIAFFKAIEEANAEKEKEYQEMEEERAQLRLAKTGEREKARKEKQKALDEAKKAVVEEGGWWKATDHVPEADKKAIAAGFEKFATKESEFDNADKDQDGEWWKKDPFRRDWERNKGKGKKWTAVVDGSPEKATESELAVREEFYKGNDWWKADKYKRDWDATKDNDWWKEEPYIKDWQNNKQDGQRWLAADEETGLESEGDKYPATSEEQKRREDWYKANGPRGVVKAWNSATEGDPEKCSVPEKEAREEFYRNGDWWKGDEARADFHDNGLDGDALNFAKAPTDAEWWKAEPYREDFWEKGDDGAKWNAITEDAGIDGLGDKKPAPAVEKQLRADWYKDNWWKQPEHKEDWKKNGKEGRKWKAPTAKDAASGNYKKPVGGAEQKMRDEWYRNGDNDEWWKQPQFVEDYHQKGPDGRHWNGKTEQDGLAGKAQENPAAPEETQKREDWYKANWWKQPKYVDDFHKNGALGDAWQSKKDDPNTDKDWWKQPVFIENWAKTMKPKTQPADAAEWWKQPQYIEDYNQNGPDGAKWTGKRETDGIEGKGKEKPAENPEKEKREEWYKNNWWKAPRYGIDWAKRGPQGDEWRAASKESANNPKKGATKDPATPEEQKEREEWYRPVGDMWRAVAEEPAFEGKAAELPCTKTDAQKRDEWYRQNWWKAPEYQQDWKENGPKATKWPAGCEASGKDGKAWEDPCSDDEKAKRDEWYRNAADNEWWKEPQYCEDWAHSGPDGARWTADTRPNANKNGGKEHPATDPEKAEREKWYKDNWWKTPAAYDDWVKNGRDGPTCGRDKPAEVDRQDPETIGDGWWKKPEFIEDWLNDGDEGRHWTAEDPAAAAAGQGHKKPATDPEKAEREKWYKDNWWKAPSCADDWAKKGANGDKWGAADPEATKTEDAQEKPAPEAEKEKREDWYRKHGDADWWKKPEFIEDHADNGDAGAKWTAGNPTAGALGLGKDCPASGPEKQRRKKWYGDNWWKAPEHIADWEKGPEEGTGSWKRDATPEEEAARDKWYKQNKGTPATEEEKDDRDEWFKKHGKATDPEELAKREEWLKKQLPDGEKAKRMEWLRDRPQQEKRILQSELPEALAAINEGQKPTDKQIKQIMDQINWSRANKKNDFDEPEDDGMKKKGTGDDDDEDEEDEGPTISAEEFARAAATFYVAPDEDEKEMKAEEEKQDQEKDEWNRQAEEAAYLAMDKKDELEAKPEDWQRNYKDPEAAPEEFWKQPKFLEEYQKDPHNEDAEWRKKGEGDKEEVTPEEQAAREDWMKDNWWKAPKFSQEWRQDPESANFKKTARPDEDEDGCVRDDDETPEADEAEIERREDWFKNARNPERNVVDKDAAPGEDWKTPAMIEDYQDGGDRWKEGAIEPGQLAKRENWIKDNHWKAPESVNAWKAEQKGHQPDTKPYAEDATPEEKKEREDWFRANVAPDEIAPEKDTWASKRQPPKADDDDGMGRRDKADDDDGMGRRDKADDDDDGMGRGDKADDDDGMGRRDKADDDDGMGRGDKADDDDGMGRRDKADDDDGMGRKDKAAPAPAKQEWQSAPPKQVWQSARKQEPEQESTPDTWQSKRPPPPPAQAKADTWVSKKQPEPVAVPKAEPLPPPPPPEDPFHGEKIREEDFPFHGEKLREEDFEVFDEEVAEFFGEKIREEDFVEKHDEEIAEFFGEKIREEDFDGEKYDEEVAEFFGEKLREEDFVDKVDEEVAEFFGEKLRDDDFAVENEEKPMKNDDDTDGSFSDPESEPEFVEAEEEPEAEEAEEEEEDDPWDDEVDEEVEEEESEEDDDNEHQEDSDLEDELEAALEEQEQEWEEDEEDDDDEDEHEADQDEDDSDFEEQDDDPEKAPEPWMLPLPEVTNNIYLKSYFPVLKFHPGKKSTAADRRVWVVDHFAKSFYCLDANGQMKKQHDSNKLLQLERNIMDPRRARLMFFDAPKSYEVIFPSTEERERFYETGSSIRPAIRVYAPSLTKPDTAHDGGSTTTTIDGVKENAVTQKVPNPFKKTGEMVDRELSGRCKINSSKVQDEPFTLWCGTFDMCGTQPPRDSSSLEAFMPKGKYDVYALGAQDVSYQTEEGQWFQYVQEYMGKDYLVLASMQVWDITIIVLCRKKCLLKITNVEGSTKATLHKEKCGMKGAAGVCMKFHNTSLAFISVQLAARVERTKMRRINVEEIVNQIQLANKDSDLSSQFHHVFFMGNMNYRIEMESAEAQELIAAKDYQELLSHDQLLTAMREDGLLHGFVEAPITFPPTYRYKVGSSDYMMDRGRSPSYTDRILVKSTENSEIKVTGYGAAESVMTSEHKPVYATYTIRALRPHASCFHRDQEPRPQLNISSVSFTDQTHMLFRKPEIRAYSPFSEHAHRGKAFKAETMLPEFAGENLFEPIKIVVQMTEYLERNHITLIFRDTAEAREDKMFRGAAVMELKDCVEPYDQERSVDLDVLCLSKKVGTVKVNYKVTNYGYTPPPGGAPGRVPEAALMDKDEGDDE